MKKSDFELSARWLSIIIQFSQHCHSSTFCNVRLLKYRISVPGQQVYNRHFLSGQFRHSILSKFEWRYFQTTYHRYIIDARGSLISALVPDQDRTSGFVVDFVVDIIITEVKITVSNIVRLMEFFVGLIHSSQKASQGT